MRAIGVTFGVLIYFVLMSLLALTSFVRRMMHFRMPVLVLAGLLALGATRSVAGPPTDQLKGAIGAVQRVLGDQTLQPQAKAKVRRAALRRAVHEMFDREESARRALAYHWRDRTDAERAEFATLFGNLLERAYLSTLDRYEGETIYTGEVIHGDRAKAGTLGFSHIEATLIATATSELARNILAHARRGEIILLLIEQDARRGIVVVARDEGPGIPDIAQAMKEGFSTIRSLGRGLPGVRRLMDELEIASEVDRGTTVIAKKWKSR